jgi:hypothetical protein
MWLTFLMDYTVNGLLFKKDETYFINDDMFARYLIRKKSAVEMF